MPNEDETGRPGAAEAQVRQLAEALDATFARNPSGGFVVEHRSDGWTVASYVDEPPTWAWGWEALRKRAVAIVGEEAAAVAALSRAADCDLVEAAARRRAADAERDAALAHEERCIREHIVGYEAATQAREALPPAARRAFDALRDAAGGEAPEEGRRPVDAATAAFDAIAAACGCPRWEYPGQLVRDVRRLADRAAQDRAEAERAGREVAVALAERDRLASLAAEAADACDAAEAVADAVRAAAGCGCADPREGSHGPECAPRALARFAAALAEARREAAAAAAPCLGREQRPTEAEAVAHAAAGGGWLLFGDDPDGATLSAEFFDAECSLLVLGDGSPADGPPRATVFVPVDANRRVCAWPAGDPAHDARVEAARAECAGLAAALWGVDDGVRAEHGPHGGAFLASVTDGTGLLRSCGTGPCPERAYLDLAATLRGELRAAARSARSAAAAARQAAESAELRAAAAESLAEAAGVRS